jgi:site-specific DNA-methyltransferase (adenine-specific)
MTKNKIICGNAIDVLKDLNSNSVDLVVTDPPYLIDYRERCGRRIANDSNADGVLPAFSELFRVLKNNSLCITFTGWKALNAVTTAWADAGFQIVGQIVWTKDYASSKGLMAHRHETAFVLAKGWPRKPVQPISNVQDWVYTGNKLHPTEKSVDIIGSLIRAFAKRGDTVLDPFLGSGTTAVAAALNGRSCIGVELEQKYCTLAEQRLLGVERYLASQNQPKAA